MVSFRKRRGRTAALVLIAGVATSVFAGPQIVDSAQRKVDSLDAAAKGRFYAATDPIANKWALAQCSVGPFSSMTTADITHRAPDANGDPNGQELATANGGIRNDSGTWRAKLLVRNTSEGPITAWITDPGPDGESVPVTVAEEVIRAGRTQCVNATVSTHEVDFQIGTPDWKSGNTANTHTGRASSWTLIGNRDIPDLPQLPKVLGR